MARFDGKVAIVTGDSTGIGRAAALAFAREGAAVVIADVTEQRGRQVASEITNAGGRAGFIAADVAVDAQVADLVARTVAEYGDLDFAFNHAGIEGDQAPTDQCTPENWAHVLAVDLTGVWLCMHYEIPPMLERGGGAIVNCSSVAGLVGFPNIGPYTATKHGVVGLTRSAALEYAQAGIRVNAVCPGVIDTEMVQRFTHDDPSAAEQLLATEPVGRMGTADEIADAIIWLCSSESTFVMAHALPVDGGFVAR
jgi:NAD(P)-dependent dehydrogenase (short-subunit alcohol dehydrogenase family)